jgi:hypothetical protein
VPLYPLAWGRGEFWRLRQKKVSDLPATHSLSRRQAGLTTNAIIGDIIFGDHHPQDALQTLTEQLRSEDAE